MRWLRWLRWTLVSLAALALLAFATAWWALHRSLPPLDGTSPRRGSAPRPPSNATRAAFR